MLGPVNDWKETEKVAEANAASEAEANKYKLRRRRFTEDRGPVPNEDQDKFNEIQTEAKALLKKIDAESEDFKNGSERLKSKRHYCQDLVYLAAEYLDTVEFLEEAKECLEDAKIDAKEFEGKVPDEVVAAIFEDCDAQINAIRAHRRELLEAYCDIQSRMSRVSLCKTLLFCQTLIQMKLRLLGSYDADLDEAVPGWDEAQDVLSERD